VGNNRLFFSGGYNAGSLMLEIQAEGDSFLPKTLFRLKPEVFGATQQTPILQNAHLYGVRPDGDLVCLDLEGNVRWSSGPEARFGLGAFLMAGDLIYAVDDVGRLSLFEATPAAGRLLAQAEVIADGREAWGPLALAGGRLFVRDLTRMVCLEVGSP
jgi:outer membrane protein assembly factor BamB